MAKDSKTGEDATFRVQVIEKISALATAAFGLVAALAWNSAIQEAFKRVFPQPDGGPSLWPLLVYAVLVTIVAVLVIIWIGRVAGRLRQAEKKEDEEP